MNPMCVVISDKPIIHNTQATVGDYGSLIAGKGGDHSERRQDHVQCDAQGARAFTKSPA